MCFVKRSSLDLTNDPRKPPQGHLPNLKNLKYKSDIGITEVKADFYEST